VNGAGFVAVGLGAALGAWTRWGLAAALNSTFPAVPLGTLTANVIGGFLIGVAMEWFGRHAGLPAEVRLLVITGFLGGLTTFSTFSAEIVASLLRGHYLWASAIALSHFAGSLLATILGVFCVRWLAPA